MTTWLSDFHEKTDLNRYPTIAYRGGIGYRLPSGEAVSNFVGHPVHYLDGGLWKPITLQRHANGDLEGSDFGWSGGHVTYKKRPLFQPKAIIFNGTRYNLDLKWNGESLTFDLPFGTYEVKFTEKGVKELLTIPDPVEGLLEFDVPHASKPNGLHKKNRHIIGGAFGESFVLTKDMKYPLVIDPDYSGTTGDGYILGFSATYSTARSTAFSQNSSATVMYTTNQLAAGDYYIYRSILKIDTSGIPDTDTITQVNLSLHCTDKAVPTTNFDVQIVKADWSGSDPLGAGNMDTIFDLGLSASLDDNIWKNSSAVSAGNRYSSGDLNTSWVSKTGYTYYMIVNGNDRANSAPSDNQTLEFATQDHGTSGNRPYLTVTHAAAATAAQVIWFS